MEFAAGVYKNIIFPVAPTTAAAHLSDLQKAMLDATPDCIKLLTADGRLLNMNRAGCTALGVPEDSGFGMPWLPLLHESVRELGAEALTKAGKGFSARFIGESRSPEGIQYWDNLLTPVIDPFGDVLSILCVSRDVTAKTALEKELEDALERQRLLSQEMRHRIKNVFAIISALISISEREAAHDQAPETATKILRDKIKALSLASDAAFSPSEIENVAMGQVDVSAVVHSVLKPYGERCAKSGDPISTGNTNLTTVAMFLHELATNSVKYGALVAEGGNVSVHWALIGRDLNLTWTECGGPSISTSPAKYGFGSEMVDRLIRSCGGSIDRSWPEQGLIADLHLPNAVD